MKQPVGALDCFTMEVCESEDLSDLSNEFLDALMKNLEDESNKVVDKRDRALEIMKNKELDNIAKLVKADKEIKSLIAEVMKQPV
ncbi:hypothetical protein QYF36_003569 [Acer negundo]|nr:hypothetical protein QYF36_003569 [Acer negundo]